MAEDSVLKDLILGYCRQVGGLVEGPAYGVYEALLPDEIAARFRIDPHQKFVFTAKDEITTLERQPPSAEGELTWLHYGHPLVESVVEELRRRIANGRFFINNVRLEKPGLFAVIEKTLQFPNARLFPVPGVMERRRLYHIVRFNFKASLIADEKRELILPVWMHLQGGYPLRGDEIERLAALEVENRFPHLELAEPYWLPDPPAQPISEEVLQPLLERARRAAQYELGDTLRSLQQRLQRFQELDAARLQQYYEDLKKDVQKRLLKADETRRPALDTKLKAIENERRSKLEDVVQKYHLRVELELLNLAVIAMPKVDLAVEIRKRTASSRRLAVWDGLRHIVEPFACDVCGLSSETLFLCEGGHLAHIECLAPQCVDCKRTFCKLCAENVRACVVCERPVCIHSLKRCPDCQRLTCQEHSGLCHAQSGEPVHIQAAVSTPPFKEVVPHIIAALLPTIPESPGSRKISRKKETPKSKAFPRKNAVTTVSPHLADRIEVYSDPAEDTISAFVFVRKHKLAVRVWELTESGISVSCYCEKEKGCLAHGYVHRPAGRDQIETQMAYFLSLLRNEYQVAENKVRYHHVRQEQAFDEPKLKLPARWKNPEVLAWAREGFDRLSR